MEIKKEKLEKIREELSALVNRVDNLIEKEKKGIFWMDVVNSFIKSNYSDSPGVIAVDISGSIRYEDHDKFLDALRENIYVESKNKPLIASLILFDQEVLLYRKPFRPQCDRIKIDSTLGGRGTDYRALFEFIKKLSLQIPYLIVFTDGYPAEYPIEEDKTSCPIMWVLTEEPTDDAIEKIGGEIIYMR